MTKEERRYIIDNERFEGSWTDFLAYLLLLASGLGVFTGVQFIFLFSIGDFVFWEMAAGMVILVVSVGLGISMYNRIKWKNRFEKLKAGKNQAENFALCSEIIRVWRTGQARRYDKKGVFKARDIESDDWNFIISATVLYHRHALVRSSLTIICTDKEILLNEYHDFVGIIPRYAALEIREWISMKTGTAAKSPS